MEKREQMHKMKGGNRHAKRKKIVPKFLNLLTEIATS